MTGGKTTSANLAVYTTRYVPVSFRIRISSTPLPRRHRLKIVRLFTALYLVQLIARIVSGVLGKLPQTCERVPKESE